MRAHWMALFAPDVFLKEVLSDFRKVKTVDRETVMVGDIVLETKIRRVIIVVTDKQRRELPHVLNFEDGHAIFIVCAGRHPVCLVGKGIPEPFRVVLLE